MSSIFSRINMIQNWTGKRGFSLVEMMTALAIVSIVMAGVYTMYLTQTQSHATQEVVVDMQQGIRLAMYLIEKEIRMAGYDPTHSGTAGIVSAQRAAITFTMDITGGETDGIDNDGDGEIDGSDLALNHDGLDNDADTLVDEDDEGDETRYGDGDVNDALEKITYSLSDDTNGDGIADSLDCSLQRQYWDGAAWQPDPPADIAFNIDALNFVYLDANGNDLIDYGLNPPRVPDARLGDIRTVQVTIVARGGQNPLRGLPGNKLDTHTYMNQQKRPGDNWDIILPVPNDRFRRFMLTAEVRCRNLGLP
jgi:prepilin-type N-terminal cleavage/methylation domain-containing protein